ncbi:MAG: Ig-like domain-containing protein [Proteobacteria bacterium]|nr:Ig-like domain-containing protein [Pseudomonadota bacterium]
MILALALAGCDGTNADSGLVEACGVEISDQDIWPAPNSSDFYYRGTIEVHLSDADDTAEISMDGVTGTTWRSDDNKTVYFTPDAPLEPNTEYTYTVSYCTADAAITFTTSELGGTMSDPTIIEGMVYDLALDSGRIVIPEGVGSVLESYLTVQIFLEVTSAGDEIEFLGAIGDEDVPGQQDYCTETLDFPEAADFSEAPYFKIGPATTNISVAGYEITIEDMLISGTFSSDGTWFGGGELSGSIDTRPLAVLVGDEEEDDAVCNLVAGFGVSCIPCPDGTNFCLEIKAVDLVGTAADTDVEEIAQGDCHENCDASWENEECDTTGWGE